MGRHTNNGYWWGGISVIEESEVKTAGVWAVVLWANMSRIKQARGVFWLAQRSRSSLLQIGLPRLFDTKPLLELAFTCYQLGRQWQTSVKEIHTKIFTCSFSVLLRHYTARLEFPTTRLATESYENIVCKIVAFLGRQYVWIISFTGTLIS